MRSEIVNDITALGGAPIFIAIAVIALMLDKSFFLQLVGGFILSYLFVFPIRMIYFRERPEKREHKNFLTKIDASSFPSHHAVRATILWLLVAYFFNNLLSYTLGVVAIILVLYTRFSLKRHHKSDVIVGLVLGVIAFLVIMFFTPAISELAQQLNFIAI